MKLSLLALWGYLVSFVLSFGEYGAYERALYWYAYEIDVAVHERPQLIAPRCTKDKPNRVRKCSSLQFLDFIDASGSDDTRPTPITRDVSGMSVDELAQTLQNYGYTGKYVPGAIINGASNTVGEIPALFKAVRRLGDIEQTKS